MSNTTQPNTPQAIHKLPLSRLRENPSNPRRWADQQKIEALGRSLVNDKQQTPIVVGPLDEATQTHTIIYGNRRYKAAILFNLTTLDAIILSQAEMDSGILTRKLLSEVAFRENLTVFEQASLYQKLLADKGTTARQLARDLGVSEGQVSKVLSIAEKITAEVRAQIEEHGLDPKGVYYLSRLSPEEQLEVVRLATANTRWSSEAIIEEVQTRLKGKRTVSQTLTLELPNGVVVKVPNDWTAEHLKKVLTQVLKATQRLSKEGKPLSELPNYCDS